MRTIPIPLADLLALVEKDLNENPRIRYGQSLWNNLLRDLPPLGENVAREIYRDDIDIFYNDKNVPVFILKMIEIGVLR